MGYKKATKAHTGPQIPVELTLSLLLHEHNFV